ncbi:response regulator [Neomoorella thermoacetica]|uniref:Stage 0 sporulation protein A homolog n=3 Tax=Neomoorella thermoacetica TaxID=1525 RepID=A0A1D7XE41_NEOTH|nr:response regulator [Moorella thermoacetica]AKX97631.1 sporulation initiation phosphotransferase F [Moorella thermoacetica]AOQ25146.1 Sporulation initiation phosphotransferase F [Moorella thermoacetica]APC09403.1 sporulation initiation phosphotransferase F [Moorella thermoacetica]OIQ09132.1 sporulation initiation phosphotransferase F [Moorella thermoacetica]OIQ10832.1 sporulation initiation phosphotransferase F [Moorella thermoacetica]
MPRLLVVDDQNGVRALLQLVFGEEGYQVALAVNGRDAIRQVEHWRPDVVVMDVKMPVMGGLEALTRIKAMAPGTAVIIMTAYVEEASLEEVWSLGADDFIYKPFDLEELKAKVRRVLPVEEPDCRKLAP